MRIRKWRGANSGHENRRTRRSVRSRCRWYVGIALLVSVLVGAVGAGWSVLARYVAHHPYFTVQEIVVETNAGFSVEEIQAWSGLAPGMSMWEIDPEQAENRLLTHSWIQTAQVRRDFPQRIHVAVGARRPVAIVLHDAPTYLDDTGVCFTRSKGELEFDLPYVSGFAGMALDAPAVGTALAGVLRLLSLARLWPEPLSEIHWDPQQGYTLFLEHRRVTIRLGWETTPEKFAQVALVLADWPVDGPAALFDARFADQIVVRPYADAGGVRARVLSRPL